MKKKIIRDIASVATLAVGLGLAIGIPLGIYMHREKSINLGKYKTNYVLNNQSQDQKISIKPTYDRKEKGLEYQWYAKTDDLMEDVSTLSDTTNKISEVSINPLEGYQPIPNANSKDFIFTKEMMQLVWMQQNPNQNLTFKCKVIKGKEYEVTDEIKVFLPKQVISITQPMLETFMFSVGSFFTSENVKTDIDQETGVINKNSDLFKKISEYFLLNTEYPGEDIIDEIKLSPNITREQNPDDYIVNFDFKLNPNYTWIKTLYSNDKTASYFVNEDSNVLHLDKVNIQQNLYTTKNINYTQQDLEDFVDFVNKNFKYSNFFGNDKQTLSNSNLAEPFRSLSVNSQIPNPLNVIDSIDLTVINKTKSNNTYEFVFHLNNGYELNLIAQSNQDASIIYDKNNKTLTISNILVDKTNDVYQDSSSEYGQLVGWNISKTSMDNVVSELLELSNGEIIPGNISSPTGIILSSRNQSAKKYLDRFTNLMKVNGLENANKLVDENPDSGTILNYVEIYNYQNQNNRKTVDIGLNLGSSIDNPQNRYYFAKNSFNSEQDKSGIWYEYDDNWTSLIIHNFPLDSYQVNNYWEISDNLANWIYNYTNFTINKDLFELTNLNDEFYNALQIDKSKIKEIKLTKVNQFNKENPTLQITTNEDYVLENIKNGYYESLNGKPHIYFDIIENHTINIFLNNFVSFVNTNSAIINIDVENFINKFDNSLKQKLSVKTKEANINIQLRQNNEYSSYFNQIINMFKLDNEQVNYIDLSMHVDNKTNKWIFDRLLVTLSSNIFNFWKSNPYYEKNDIKSVNYNNHSQLVINVNKSTNWDYESTLKYADVNENTLNKFNETINDLGPISIENNGDINSTLSDKLSELNFAQKFVKNAFDIDIFDYNIEQTVQILQENINPTFNLKLLLNSDSEFRFRNTSNLQNIEVSDDGLSLEIKNISNKNITLNKLIRFDKNLDQLFDLISYFNPNESNNTISKINGTYSFNDEQIKLLVQDIKKSFTPLKDINFSLEIHVKQPNKKLSNNSVIVEKITIILPNGYIFKDDSYPPYNKPNNKYTFDKKTPNKLSFENIEIFSMQYSNLKI